jgi:hypothetical protein
VIYEYAIDPELVKDWVLSKDVGLAPQFGMDQRRLVSDISSNWEGEVYGALWQHFEFDDTTPEFNDAYQFMAALMEFMRQGPNREAKRTDRPWLEQALGVHQEEPFHAILSSDKFEGCEAVITPSVIGELRNTRWYLPTIDVVSKTPDALADHLTPLLRLARHIVLVDPYFDPDDPAYRGVVKALLVKAITSRAPGRSWPSLTINSGIDHRQKGRESRTESTEQQWLRASKNRCELATEHLARFVPKGMEITFQCIAPFADGDEVHNRYLLTDIGGASLPYGTHPAGELVFDDVTPLFEGQYRKRWKQFGKGEGLNIIGDSVVVQGSSD